MKSTDFFQAGFKADFDVFETRLIDGKNGFVCESGNVEALYEKMKWILEHKNKLAHIKMNARKTFEDNFTLDALADRMEGIINVTMCKNSRLAKSGF